MEVSCWIRSSGIEFATGFWEGGAESGICEGLVDADELNGGTGGKGRWVFRG
jgi:hypothetical protein